MRYSCVYTQRITQRQKKFKDGFVEINQSANGFYSIIIFTEENQKVASLKITNEPILDGTDFQVGPYLIQVDSETNQLPQKSVESSYCSKDFIISSHIMPSKDILQKEYPDKTKLKINNFKGIKNHERSRKLRDIPRTFDEIVKFYTVETDPTIHRKNLVQRNLNDYLES